jgi:ubiquinone/menaquinone biosynthesis C-methylase UbiE
MSVNIKEEFFKKDSSYPPLALSQIMFGTWIAQAIYVTAFLGIADLLKDGAKDINELAQSTDSQASYLYRILRALASVEIFNEVEPYKFALTPMAEYLKSNIPGSLRGLAIMLGDEWHWRCWGDIINIVKTGTPPLKRLYQADDTFKYFADNPKSAAIFNDAMTGWSKYSHTAILDVYDFSGIKTIVDVAGGHGVLIAAILAANPKMRGILFDLPHVISGAKNLLETEGVSNRCQMESGNFFELVPDNGDAYILSHILHDWDDECCIQILNNIRKAISKGGRLLVVEGVVPPGNEPHLSKIMDIEMMIFYPRGKERTQMEYRQLFEAGGFHLNRILPTATSISVLEGVCI